MNRNLQKVFSVVILSLFLIDCKKKAFDDYYARPDSLAAPIYGQLEQKGNFKNLLTLIDKAGYKSTLAAAGYWTLFAPNDAAFTKFLQERAISGIQNVDSVTARAIVQYLLVFNAFDKETIDDYQSNSGWARDIAFRRRTAYYTGFYNDTMQNGQIVTAIQSNRNGATAYAAGDNGNKYIPYFTDVYFKGRGLTSADYTYFYPSSEYGGFNVADAKVLSSNPAENGIFHELDKVVTPLPSIDEYLRSKPEYSEFKKLYDKYMVSFIINADATRRYQLLTGDNNKQVYVKTYNSQLAFSLNNENYLKLQDNDAQQNSWSIFVPKNDVLLTYINNVLLEYYNSFENTPTQILVDFLNAHMWQSPVWPSKFSTTLNVLGEEARFNPQTDVVERKVLSNGIFYGTSKVQEANVFSTVYSRAYLDPKFSIMTRLLNTDLRFIVTDPRAKFTLFMMPDAVLRAAGYNYTASTNTYTYTPPGGGASPSSETVRQNLLRILNTGVLYGERNDLVTPGIAEAYNNEFIKWTNNQVITAGTQDAKTVVKVDSSRTTQNGKVYYLNGLLTFTTVNIGTHIVNLGGTTASPTDFNYFANYLINAKNIYNSATGEINGVTAGGFYTVLVPTNEAIKQAVKDGLLPGNTTTGAPNFGTSLTPHTDAEKLLVEKFIQYHIIAKRTIVPDNTTQEAVETLLKNSVGEVVPVTVFNTPGNMQITDVNNRKANVIISKSNNLSNRAVIHLIDNYLKY
jgi:uncharacterized surface protein with fasciclin (FAS1) repeats